MSVARRRPRHLLRTSSLGELRRLTETEQRVPRIHSEARTRSIRGPSGRGRWPRPRVTACGAARWA